MPLKERENFFKNWLPRTYISTQDQINWQKAGNLEEINLL